MSTGIVAVGAVVIAYYVYIRYKRELSPDRPIETHTRLEHAPRNWTQELYLFAEALRYLYVECVARWPTADLFIGILYLASQGIKDFPAADVVKHGNRVNTQNLKIKELNDLKSELTLMLRLLLYSQKLKHTKIILPEEEWSDLGLTSENFLAYHPKAAVLRPAYILVRDPILKSIVLAVRGTHSVKDLFTSLSGAAKPHHMVDTNGVVLGYSHFGMLAASRWLLKEATSEIKSAMESNPGYRLLITGHSMGGGAAAMLTTMLRERHPDLGNIQCYIYACPACMTIEIAKSCGQYVTSCVYGTDVVPTISPKTVDLLRDEVAQSSWGKAFKHDLRSTAMVKRVEDMCSSASNWTMRQYQTVSSSITARCMRSRSTDNDKVGESEMESLLVPKTSKSDSDILRNLEIDENQEIINNDEIDYNSEIESNKIEFVSEIEEDPITINEEKGNYQLSVVVKDRFWQLSNRISEMAKPAASSLTTWSKSTGNKVLSSLKYLSCSPKRMRMVTTESEVEDNQSNEVEGVFDGRDLQPEMSEREKEIWKKRQLYPAGKIFHIVPSYILKNIQEKEEELLLEENQMSPDKKEISEISELEERITENEFCLGTNVLNVEDIETNEEEGYVMFSDMPQEAYEKIRMCRSMVVDHFVPRYRTAIEFMISTLDKEIERHDIVDI